MRDSEYKKIRAHFDLLVKELDLVSPGIIEFLFSKEILTEEDKEDLDKKPTSHEKNRHFLTILRTKEDAAYGLFISALKKHQSHLVGNLPPPGIPRRKAKSSSGSGVGKGFEDFTTAELQEWLKPRLEKEGIPATVIEKVAEEEIDGKVFMYMTESDMKDEFSDLKFGPRKKLFLLKNEVMETTTPLQVEARPLLPRHERTEHAREFGCKPQSSEKYIQTKILNQHEARSSASFLDPVHQFFPCSEDEERENIYDFMAEKVAVFSAACLNDRRNGTVHFGIGNADCPDFRYGEVLGLPLEQKECEDTMMNFLCKHFSSEAAADAALKCINVFFVEVVLRDREEPATHFVCEVDVEPKSEVVQNLAFFVDLNRDASSGKQQTLIRFDNGVPTQQDQAGVVKFTEEKESLTKERQQQEKTPTTRAQNLPQLLKNFLCGGGDKLDGSYVHLLATGSVDFTQTDIEESFKFISSVDWRGIFDFDATSADHGLYQFLDEKEEMLYKVKTVENFSAPPTADTGGQSSLVELFQDMDESELKTWIFCNGYQGTEEEGLNITQWKKKRSAGFKEVVRYFRNNIPDERGVIIILVTTKDDVFIEACEELLLSFQNQWVMIAESKQLADAWIDGLQKRNVEVDSSRCLSNFSFAEVSKAIQQLKGAEAFTSDICVVKSSAGLEEEVSKKKVQELCDLEIVSATECKVADGEVDLDAVSKHHEEEFYKGNRATWWNFYCPGHVCPRDKLDDLKRQTREVLDGDDASDGDNIGFVEIYHQPGAGGTTVAMNVVWDLHTEFKSCVIKRITKDTASQILTLYELGERNPSQTKPVLVMLDNEDEGIDGLKRRIEDECQTRDINKLVCVFLICWRRMTLPPDHQARNILLEQKLSTREKRFFVDKYEELKKKGKANVDNLLGLNIMKEDFNEDYIRRTVAEFVGLHKLHDRTILLYTAVLNCYDLFFRGIPVACFDLVMPSTFQHRRKPWEITLIETPLMLFFPNTKLGRSIKCLRITSQLLCKYILDELCAGEKSHEDLMEEFLMSPTFKRQSGDFAVKELLNIVKDCLKKRGMASNGKKRCKFSPFIQMLIDEEKIEEATRCIQLVYERQEDAFLAQQVARVYITVKNWDKAEEWAGKATQKLPNNSFLWDTRGQICRSRLAEIRADCETSLGSDDSSKIATAVKYAHEGSMFFEKVDELSKKERNDPPNTSGLFGQMEIAVVLCNILKYLPDFASNDDLIRFFSGQKELPKALQNTKVQKYVPWLRSLQEKAFGCLKSVEDQMMLLTSDLGLTYTSSKFFLSPSNIHSFEERLNNAFGEDDSSGTADPKQLSPEKRQRMMRKLGGNSLFSIISKCQQEEDGQDRARRIWQFASLTLEEAAADQRSMSRTDLSMALASALTLISCHDDSFGERDYNKLLMWSTTLLAGTKNPEEEEHYINLDPYVCFFAFHWPSSNRMNLSNLCKPDVLRRAMDRARSGFIKIGARGGSSSRRNNPMFFVTKTKGLNCIIHKFHLQALSGRRTEKMVSKLLRHPKAIELVERFNGILMKNGQEVSTEVVQQGNKFTLKVPLFVRESRQTLWNKKVYFALGIGPGGPVACDVSADIPTPKHSGLTSGSSGDFRRPFLQRHPSRVMQIEAKITEIRQQLAQIRSLKSNSQSRMTAAQAKRLQSEEAQLLKTLGQLQKERREEEESIFL